MILLPFVILLSFPRCPFTYIYFSLLSTPPTPDGFLLVVEGEAWSCSCPFPVSYLSVTGTRNTVWPRETCKQTLQPVPGRPRGGAANSAKEMWHESFTLELDWEGRISYIRQCVQRFRSGVWKMKRVFWMDGGDGSQQCGCT